MQSKKESYSEKQRFRQVWLWACVLVGPAILSWIIIKQIALADIDFTVGITWIIFGVGFPIFMYRSSLDTEVSNLGVHIRFRPFHRKWVAFDYANIERATSLTYSPLKDYGGWGIRYGKKGKAYNVSGNKGVLLTLKDGKNVLIGSNNPESLCSAINVYL